MAASAADIRSALSIPEASSSAGPSQTKKPVPSNTRRPEGISRELYSLIGPSAPSLAQLAKPRLKQRPNFGGRGGKTKWSFSFFCFILHLANCSIFRLLGSYDLSLMLDDRIISNFSIGRRLHQTLQ